MKYNVKISKENGNSSINIGEDEIIEVKYSIGLVSSNDFANNRSSIEMEIKGKMISNLEERKFEDGIDNDSLYTRNKKNIISLAEWAESYMKEDDYRNVEVFVNLGSNKKIEYKFMNMFVQEFLQELSIEKGIGIFILKLRQKFHQEDKMKIK